MQTLDITPDWRNFYLFLMQVKKEDRLSYQRMVKLDKLTGNNIPILLDMAIREGWNEIAKRRGLIRQRQDY